jgi:quercetin dioxygenase-like cupin family protein
VVRGQVEVHLGSVCSLLSEGDTISFNPDFEHWYQNPTSDLATLISVSTPPSL